MNPRFRRYPHHDHPDNRTPEDGAEMLDDDGNHIEIDEPDPAEPEIEFDE